MLYTPMGRVYQWVGTLRSPSHWHHNRLTRLRWIVAVESQLDRSLHRGTFKSQPSPFGETGLVHSFSNPLYYFLGDPQMCWRRVGAELQLDRWSPNRGAVNAHPSPLPPPPHLPSAPMAAISLRSAILLQAAEKLLVEIVK